MTNTKCRINCAKYNVKWNSEFGGNGTKNTEGSRTFSVRTIGNWNELSVDVKKASGV